MEKKKKCKICGCIFAGIIVFANFPICEKCLKQMHDTSEIIRNEPQTQIRGLYVSGINNTASASGFDIDGLYL